MYCMHGIIVLVVCHKSNPVHSDLDFNPNDNKTLSDLSSAQNLSTLELWLHNLVMLMQLKKIGNKQLSFYKQYSNAFN